MKRLLRILSLPPIVLLLSLFLTIPALALPPLPSSFYGTVKVNNANVPDGTVIQALVGGQVYAEGFTQTYQGDSIFGLDVAGDNTDTATLDGGRDGDTIQFKIAGLLADQTAVWHSGTNVNLNLTATSSEPISAPPAIPTSVPTQTRIVVLIQPSPLPSISVQSVPSTTLVPASPIATKPSQSSHVTATDVQASSDVQTSSTRTTPPKTNKQNRSGNISPAAVVVIALPILTAAGYTFWTLRKKKM
ncbi:MAG: hypothetical protein EHM33_30825 [Chloroflexi bacterium]|nr:MAG: hypothetical protein EHM33_30825 [Chloroflexota bacterium]